MTITITMTITIWYRLKIPMLWLCRSRLWRPW